MRDMASSGVRNVYRYPAPTLPNLKYFDNLQVLQVLDLPLEAACRETRDLLRLPLHAVWPSFPLASDHVYYDSFGHRRPVRVSI